MANYRRLYIPNSTYFFTVVTYGRRPWFADEENIDLLREAFRYTKERHPFELDAIVILPDHLHCIWKMTGDTDFSKRWQMIKTHFSRKINVRKNHRGAKSVWQPRFWEHCIRDEDDYSCHLDYIHYNPAKHGLVAVVKDWPHSSFHRFVEKGLYDEKWGQNTGREILKMNIE